jgi:PGRS subfamily gly rich protein
MVSSPMYDRLMTFAAQADFNAELQSWDSDHKRVIDGFDQAIERVRHFQEHQGFTGKTGEALKAWADQTVARLEAKRSYYMGGIARYVAARQAIAQAAADARRLSPTLIDSKTAAMRDAAKVVLPYTPAIGVVTGGLPGLVANTVLSTGSAYVDAVEAQANAMREVAATEILERLNGGLNELSAGVNTLTQTGISDSSRGSRRTIPVLSEDTATNLARGYVSVSAYDRGVYGRSAEDDYGRAALRSDKSLYPDGYADPETDEFARRRALASQQVSKRYFPPDMDGSYDRPITNPQDLMGVDLMHTRVDANHHRNGVVWGGHVPANPTDIDHPLWRINGGPAANGGSAGRLAGLGSLGAGALGLRGAARMGTGSLGGSGASALTAGTYSGKGLGTYSAPSQAGSGSAAGTSVSGTTGTPGTAGTSGAQSSASGAGRGSFMGSGMGAGAGASKDDKKAKRRKYQAYRYLDDDPDALPEGYVNPMSQTYGSDKDLAPAKREDDGWDPRQW